MNNYYIKIIEKCNGCDNYSITSSGKRFCKETGEFFREPDNKMGLLNVGIPNNCPKIFKKIIPAKTISNVYKLVLDSQKNISKDELRILSDLIHKGISFDQVKFERDIAVSQLHSIGLSLGEKTDHIVEILSRFEDDMK